jgi:Tol biopolymer transport system component
MSRPLAVLVIVVALLLGALGGALALAAGGEGEPQTVLVSRTGADGPGGDGNSVDPAISGDGRYVAFVSVAKLVPGVKGGKRQIYVRDLVTKKTVLVSRADGAAGAAGEGRSDNPTISADGRYVAFSSGAENLSPDDIAYSDVFVRDLVANTTTLVSRASAPGSAAADGDSYSPAISADGRHVAFESSAGNLSAEDVDTTTETRDIFVRDLDTGLTELASRASGATGAAGVESSSYPTISGDGRYVAFESRALLVPGDVDVGGEGEDIFVRDRAAATTELVDRKTGAAGAAGDAEAGEAAISTDGRHVVFESDAKLTGQRGYGPNLFLRNLDQGTTKLVTVGAVPRAGRPFFHPSISAEGRYVAFEASADGLTAVDARQRTDAFARDMAKGVTVEASRASGQLGLPADGPSFNTSISADGRFVAFDSRATNLSGADSDEFSDVFRRSPVYTEEPPLPTCAGRPATIVGTPGRDVIHGSTRSDVIVALGGDDVVKGGKGADTICAGAGDDTVETGPSGGRGGVDLVLGGAGNDHITLGPDRGTLKGEAGNDVLVGSREGDGLVGGPGNDVLYGGPNPSYNPDYLYGGPGNDKLFGGPGPDTLRGGSGHNLLVPGPGENR